MSLESIEAQLTGPGGPFEIVEEEVLGTRMAVCKSRPPSLRALLEDSASRGDDEYIIYEDQRSNDGWTASAFNLSNQVPAQLTVYAYCLEESG